MKKLSLVLVALVMMAFAPGAMACALCDGENCWWDIGPEYFAAECWYEWCPPCGCYTTGHCWGPSAALTAPTDLSLEYRIASVEIRQGDAPAVVAHKTADAPAVVAQKQPVQRK